MPEKWARVDHVHGTPQFPRWVRYLAWVVMALTFLTIVLSVLLGRTEQRLDDLEGRFETVCEALMTVPEQTANSESIRERLDCGPSARMG